MARTSVCQVTSAAEKGKVSKSNMETAKSVSYQWKHRPSWDFENM